MSSAELEQQIPGLGAVIGFPIGHQVIGDCLVMARLRSSAQFDPISFFRNCRVCLFIFYAYLAEVNNYLVTMKIIEKLPIQDRRSRFGDPQFAADYVRNICRFAPLCEELPEFGIEDRPGVTVENLAYIRKRFEGQADVFSREFTPDKAIEAWDKVRISIAGGSGEAIGRKS